jgi:hypothetical protein
VDHHAFVDAAVQLLILGATQQVQNATMDLAISSMSFGWLLFATIACPEEVDELVMRLFINSTVLAIESSSEGLGFGCKGRATAVVEVGSFARTERLGGGAGSSARSARVGGRDGSLARTGRVGGGAGL